jgi:hypothetical protein
MPHSTSYRRILHRMGYYNYQQGLIYRHLNQQNEWESHLEHCRSFILKSLDIVKPSRVTVLGSGWLMELPLAEMTERIEKIILVDIVHPPEVIRQSAGLKNVELSEQDVSGGLIGEVWKKAGRRTFFNRLPSLDTIVVPDYEPAVDPGMVISVNILTQLEALPERLLRKKTKADDGEFIMFKRKIQESHLRLLKLHPSVLISDVSEVVTDVNETQSEIKTMFIDLPAARMKDEWVWDFDLTHIDYNRKKSRFKISAVLI